MKQTFWLMGWVFAIEVVIGAFFIPSAMIEKVIIDDLNTYNRVLGVESTINVRKSAEAWVTQSWLESGYKDALIDVFVPTDKEKAESLGLAGLGSKWFVLIKKRIDILTVIIFLLAIRIYYILMWMPFLPFILVPSIIDGWLSRKIKQTNYEYSSPTWHRYGVRSLVVVFLIALVTLILPVAVSPLVIPCILMVIALMTGTIFSNMQKRI